MPLPFPPSDPAARAEEALPAVSAPLDALIDAAAAAGWTRAEVCEALVWGAAQRLVEEAGPTATEDVLMDVQMGVVTAAG